MPHFLISLVMFSIPIKAVCIPVCSLSLEVIVKVIVTVLSHKINKSLPLVERFGFQIGLFFNSTLLYTFASRLVSDPIILLFSFFLVSLSVIQNLAFQLSHLNLKIIYAVVKVLAIIFFLSAVYSSQFQSTWIWILLVAAIIALLDVDALIGAPKKNGWMISILPFSSFLVLFLLKLKHSELLSAYFAWCYYFCHISH